ncbi:hypothetical protein BD309DRAFT_952578 [Dichomitus squalens]|uniref:Uncharacterized protein n=1 Tax=Dichomitus squalens TaxID=114155 RepID=A0A4Q9NYW8_9APHY|nr:hypothetical protein BD309DRAFT_952578 [Dichomitus squalens]TBU60767.1 hypothetical protein BD310DRAFT_922019 [Dichomitus squalens]
MTVLSKATVAALFLLLASDAFGKLDPQLTAHSKSLGGLDLSKAQVGSLTNAMSAGSLKKVGNRDTTMATKSIGKNRLGAPVKKRSPSPVRRDDLDTAPTPAPTGPSTDDTTVHITDENDFALLLPGRDGELISDAESDGVAFCTPASGDATCQRRMSDGFISAAHVERSGDSKWIQITGCLDVSKSHLDDSDSGGQFDVRFPNGAKCTFGGYGASFIEIVEPAANRFCLRCCSLENDQENCNSRQDTAGCPTAIPGTYSFPDLGVSCE